MTYPISTNLGAYASGGGLSGTFIPEIWSGKLITKFYAATVFAAISNTDYEGEISGYGDKVIIRTVPDITINSYKIGDSLDYTRPTSSNVELLIDKGKYYALHINDVEKKQADIDFINKWSEDASEQLKITIDTEILADVYPDGNAYNEGTTAGKISGNINLGAASADGSSAVGIGSTGIIQKVIEAGQCLTEQNIPEKNRWIVLTAWLCTRIKLSELAEASYSGDGVSMKRNGRIGRIDHFELYSSNNITPVTETAVTSYPCIYGHKSALTFASQLVESETIPNPNDFGQLMRGLQVYGYKVIKPEAMGCIYCKSA